MADPVFNVVLHHLSPDAKSAGVNFVNEPVAGVTAVQLRGLLRSLGEVAARLTIYEPATPEIRIRTERNAFVVRTRHRRLCLLGWENRLRGEEHTVNFIINTVTNAPETARAPGEAERRGPGSASPVAGGSSTTNPPMRSGAVTNPPFSTGSATNPPMWSGSATTPPFSVGTSPPLATPGTLAPSASPPLPEAEADEETTERFPRWAKIAGLAVLIVGCNAVTVWQVFFATGPSPVPNSQPITDFDSGALLVKAAGEYETGGAEGDRRLVIEPTGGLRVAKYGAERAILQEMTKTARGGVVEGRTVLITSDPAVIEIKDANTVVYFGTTYQRRNR
jgi:hypothetical protein